MSQKNIVFYLRNIGYFRNIEWLVQELYSDPSNNLTIILGRFSEKEVKSDHQIEDDEVLQTQYPRITLQRVSFKVSFGLIEEFIKKFLDYHFFVDAEMSIRNPAFARVLKHISKSELFFIKFAEKFPWFIKFAENYSTYMRFDKNITKKVIRIFSDIQPDLVILTPAVADKSVLILASVLRRIKIPTIGLLISWDNLTIKGRFLDVFEKVLIWSVKQGQELEELHNFRGENARIIMEGCYPYAHRMLPNTKNVKELRHSPSSDFGGISKKIVTWFTSSNFIRNDDVSWQELARNVWTKDDVCKYETEYELIYEFLFQLKSRLQLHNTFQFIIRLHPSDATNATVVQELQRRVEREELEEIVFIEKSGNPFGEVRRQIYEILLDRTSFGIGLATTSIFELGMLGKVCFAPPGNLSERSFSKMIHGRYLLQENGGPVVLSDSWDDFFAKILRAPENFAPSGVFKELISPELDSNSLQRVKSRILETTFTSRKESYSKSLYWILRIHLGIVLFSSYLLRNTLLLTKRKFPKKLKRFFKRLNKTLKRRVMKM